MKKNVVLIVVLVVVALAVFLVIGLFGYINGVRNEGLSMEFGLNAQYQDNQNYLSAFISGFYEQVGIAQAQGDVLQEILLETVKGRYDESGFGSDSLMFGAIVEAYPEAGVAELLANWGKIQDYIASQREGYRNEQSKLLDMLRTYDNWRKEGLIKHLVVQAIGFPTDNLVARIGDKKVSGPEALEKMYQIVLTQSALDAYESGTMDPLSVPED